jgi:GGDEF domain-containing protein
MKYLRFSILALLIVQAIFLKIERLRFEEDMQLIDIQKFVYVLGVAILAVTIGVPSVRRISRYVSLAVWLGIYLALKVFVYDDPTHALLGDYHTYVSITEVAFLTILVLLAHTLAHHLHDFEQAIENVTFAGFGKRVQTLHEAEHDLQTELIRSRRHQRPLTVIVIEPDPNSVQANLHRTVQEVQRAMMGRYVLTSLARAVSDTLRRTDKIFKHNSQDRFVVVCPETDTKASDVLIERIKTAATEQLGVIVHCGVSSFPTEALTFEELVHRAEAQFQKQETASQPTIIRTAESRV